MLFRTVFPTRALRVGVRINFVQDEQQDLQDIPYDFGHLCSGRRIRTSGHSDLALASVRDWREIGTIGLDDDAVISDLVAKHGADILGLLEGDNA